MRIQELSDGIEQGKWTCTDLTSYCLQMIADHDQDGRKLNSVAEINPDVWFDARRIDEEIRTLGLKSPLHGIPVLLKDNIDVKGMHTTAGSLALADLIAEEDAFIVKQLREAGALILGKANLSEFAYFMSRQDMPSGYSSRSGQVVHPYDPAVNPSGSSSGSAVAAAARLVPYTIGTETDGSLMSPAITNAIVSIKPTVGLVSRAGILPLSRVQDTAGPMCTSLEDAAVVLQVLAGEDENDAATQVCRTDDYFRALSTDCRSMRIGIYGKDLREEDAQALDQARLVLKEAGAEIVEIEMEETLLDEFYCLSHEFKCDLNAYLKTHNSACRTLHDIIEFNKADSEHCLVHGQNLLEESEEKSGRLMESEYLRKRAELHDRSRVLLDGTLDEHDLDVLLSAGGRPTANLAPISGNPCMTVPAVIPDEEKYSPVSYYLMGRAFSEAVLLRTAYTLEQGLDIECRPSWNPEETAMF